MHPRDGEYPADERYFVSCILAFFEESLSGRAEMDRGELARWLEARRTQLAAGKLVLIVHQLDVCAAPSSEPPPRERNATEYRGRIRG